MTKRAATFSQSDLKRALRAVQSAGIKVGRLEIDLAGTIVVVAAENSQNSSSRNSWDDILPL